MAYNNFQPGMPDGAGQPWSPAGGGPPPGDFREGNDIFDDDESAQPPSFGPPTMDGIPSYQGYEAVGGFKQQNPLPPPPAVYASDVKEQPQMDFGNMTTMDSDACREAMLEFVSEHCCYGSGAAKNMMINNIEPGHALHYTLETFTEARSTGYTSAPYRGGFVDGPENGAPPMPWAIPCSPDSMFNDHFKILEVPHTSTVRPCHGCNARGYNRCYRCHGWGQVRCSSCWGKGHKRVHTNDGWESRRCSFCGGDGRRRCFKCGGDGRITCSECHGFRYLRFYIELVVKFTNNLSDYILEKTDMPDELVRDVGGTVIFEQTLLPVFPITSYYVPEVNDNSVRMVDAHKHGFPGTRYLLQRQVLRGVPVTEVHYKWKDVASRFWVYGNERRVYAPDYPQQCCWGCTIL